jgi:hypothetical protein
MAYKPVGVNESSQFPPRVESHIQSLIDGAVEALVDGAPGALDTLNELATQLATDETASAALTTAVAGKLAKASNLSDLSDAAAARTNLGLGNVNNTSDANKPVSTAQAAADNLRVPYWQPSTAYADRQAVINPSGDIVYARAAFTSGGSYDQTKWNYYNLVRDLPTTGLVNGHRGGGAVYPEETLGAYDTCAAAGVHILEGDTQILADGTRGMHHDLTVDRVTSGTGNVKEFTAPSLKALNMDYVPWPVTEHPAILDDVVRKWGGRKVLVLQNSTSGQLASMLDYFDSRKLRGAVMVEASSATDVTTATSRGYDSWIVYNADPVLSTVQAAVTAGVTYVRVDVTTTDANIASYIALGRPVAVGGVMRRTERDHALSLGCVGVATDWPVYHLDSLARATTDPWRKGTLGTGTLWNSSGAPTISSGAIVGSAGTTRIVPGDLCPYASPTSKTITFDMQLTTAATSPYNFGMDFAINDDGDATNATNMGASGYRFQINGNDGTMTLLRAEQLDRGLAHHVCVSNACRRDVDPDLDRHHCDTGHGHPHRHECVGDEGRRHLPGRLSADLRQLRYGARRVPEPDCDLILAARPSPARPCRPPLRAGGGIRRFYWPPT